MTADACASRSQRYRRRVTDCVECGATATEDHHVVPRSRSGTFTVPLCGSCHGRAHGISRPTDIGALTRNGLERARSQGVILGRPTRLDPLLHLRIHQLREQGLSLQKIANTLNEERVPTAGTGASWWPSTIKMIVDRPLPPAVTAESMPYI